MAETKFSVAGDQLVIIDRRMWDIKRQLFVPNGSPLDPEKVAQSLQVITEGGSIPLDFSEVRQTQAFRLYDTYGIGEDLGYSSFADYLEAIPPIPAWPDHYSKHFDKVALVERRLGLKKLCNAVGIRFEGDDETFVPHDPKRVKAGDVYWALYQDGRKNRNKSVTVCRGEFQKFEAGLDALEGCCAYAQDRRHLLEENKHVMDLPGSVRRDSRGGAAILRLVRGRPKLCWDWSDCADPEYGSASRGE